MYIHRRGKADSNSYKKLFILWGSLCCEVIIPLIQLFHRRRDVQCQAFVKKFLRSQLFKIIMISTISINSFLVVLWTDYNTRYNFFRLFEVSRPNDPFFPFYFTCFNFENVIQFLRSFVQENFL